jgi:formylglycine-generating enzyme required for sulfatase activity
MQNGQSNWIMGLFGMLSILLTQGCGTRGQAFIAHDRRVVIQNESGENLWLFRATRDVWAEARPLGRAYEQHLQLPAGRYAIGMSPDAPLTPLPLPLQELGYEAPPEMILTITSQPDPQSGWSWIPSGPCLNGDDLGVGQETERPLKTPEVASFWMATHETSNAQFIHFLNSIDKADVNQAWLDLAGRKCQIKWNATTDCFQTDAPTLPVVTVSHSGATAYCQWLTQSTGIPHRLPSEIEWEKAARGPGSRVYAYGDTCRTLAANQESGQLKAIGGFTPNGFGLFDMTGNAFEWTKDTYKSGRANSDDTSYRSLRGGSFMLDGIFLRNSMRMRLRPSVRADDVGFRVLRECVRP